MLVLSQVEILADMTSIPLMHAYYREDNVDDAPSSRLSHI